MIDAFLKPECMGNFQEIENVFANAPEPDIEKLRGYLQRLGSERVWRQAGYLLEKHRGIDISGLMEMSRNYYPANPFAKGSGINRKWRLRT